MNNIDKEIAAAEARVAELRAQKANLETVPFNPVGLWKVTTEGDCEGKSITDLGTHEGNLFDIANALRQKSYYKLSFARVAPKPKVELVPDHQGSVYIEVQDTVIRFGDTDLMVLKLAQAAPETVKVTRGHYFNSAHLEWPKAKR